MNTTQFIPSSSGLIIGTSPIENTNTGRIVFNIDGVAATSDQLTYSASLLEVGNAIKIKSSGLYPILSFENISGHTSQIQMYYNQLYFNTGASSTVLDNVGLSIGFGGVGASARLDVKSPGDFNTHIVQRWRNFAGTADLAKLTGDGALTIGAYTNSNTKLSVTGTTYGIYGAGATAFFADAGGSGTRIGYDSTARSTTVGGLSIGVRGIADGGGATGINRAVQGQANGSGTNYAGYFDAINGTLNYALYVQRGLVNLGTMPTSSDGLSAGDLFTQTATQLGLSGTTKIICQV